MRRDVILILSYAFYSTNTEALKTALEDSIVFDVTSSYML
jgi:hypothetical protein